MQHSNYFPERMGHARISPEGRFEAGSFQSFELVYTAGYFGIDDTGSLKIVPPMARCSKCSTTASAISVPGTRRFSSG
jgi:hypothetical protein